jgi:hypothetical protein
MVRAKGARDLQAPPLQLPLGMIGLAPAADLDGSGLFGRGHGIHRLGRAVDSFTAEGG